MIPSSEIALFALVSLGVPLAIKTGAISGLIWIFPLLVFLCARPDWGMAVFFNFAIAYFYAYFKLGLFTDSISTAVFYGCATTPCIIHVALSFLNKKSGKAWNKIDFAVILMTIVIFVSYFMSGLGSEVAFTKLSFLPFFVLAPYFGTRYFNSLTRFRRLFFIIMILGVALLIPAYYELLFNPLFAGRPRFSMYVFELASDTSRDNPILFGMTFSIVGFLLLATQLEAGRFSTPRVALALLSFFLVLRSTSRGATLSLLVMIFVYFALSRMSARRWIYLALFCLGIGLSFHYLGDTSKDYYEYGLSAEARGDGTSSVSQRVESWTNAWEDFKSHPIFGVGFGRSAEGTGYPHNMVMEVLAEFGAVGAICILAPIILAARATIHLIRLPLTPDARSVLKILLSLFVYHFTETMFSGYLTQQSGLFVSMGLLSSATLFLSKHIIRPPGTHSLAAITSRGHSSQS